MGWITTARRRRPANRLRTGTLLNLLLSFLCLLRFHAPPSRACASSARSRKGTRGSLSRSPLFLSRQKNKKQRPTPLEATSRRRRARSPPPTPRRSGPRWRRGPWETRGAAARTLLPPGGTLRGTRPRRRLPSLAPSRNRTPPPPRARRGAGAEAAKATAATTTTPPRPRPPAPTPPDERGGPRPAVAEAEEEQEAAEAEAAEAKGAVAGPTAQSCGAFRAALAAGGAASTVAAPEA
jgi:hypothetical protein